LLTDAADDTAEVGPWNVGQLNWKDRLHVAGDDLQIQRVDARRFDAYQDLLSAWFAHSGIVQRDDLRAAEHRNRC
jgi:hypothetical protein